MYKSHFHGDRFHLTLDLCSEGQLQPRLSHVVSGERLQKDHQHFPLSKGQSFLASERQQGRKQRTGE